MKNQLFGVDENWDNFSPTSKAKSQSPLKFQKLLGQKKESMNKAFVELHLDMKYSIMEYRGR